MLACRTKTHPKWHSHSRLFFQKQAYIPFILNQKIIRLFLKAAYHLIPITLKVFGNVLQNIKIAKSMKCFIFSTSKKTDVWAWNCLHWWKYPWDYGLFSSLCIPWIFRWLVWQPQCMPLQTLRWVEKKNIPIHVIRLF